MPPERVGGRWLVDGGLVNVLPVDAAWMADPDLVIAIRVGGPWARRLPQLRWPVTGALSRLGSFLPNPATAKMSFELLARATEIILERQAALCVAMTNPELLVEPELGDMGLRDFDRLDEAVAVGSRAATAALPALVHLLGHERQRPADAADALSRHVDPVYAMVVHPLRARAATDLDGVRYYFCSVNCRDRFLRCPARYLRSTTLGFAAPRLS
ncbi:MAG: hypothetical protein SFV24_19870 [Gemmatimonadales bacterium]|nr:hypothetical protein [Gemmatimonadales bacterium]